MVQQMTARPPHIDGYERVLNIYSDMSLAECAHFCLTIMTSSQCLELFKDLQKTNS